MNLEKCGFGVLATKLEVKKNKTNVVLEAGPPSNKKELQSFLGKVNFLRIFISNLSRRMRIFASLVKLKAARFCFGALSPRGFQPD